MLSLSQCRKLHWMVNSLGWRIQWIPLVHLSTWYYQEEAYSPTFTLHEPDPITLNFLLSCLMYRINTGLSRLILTLIYPCAWLIWPFWTDGCTRVTILCRTILCGLLNIALDKPFRPCTQVALYGCTLKRIYPGKRFWSINLGRSCIAYAGPFFVNHKDLYQPFDSHMGTLGP